jgi:serine/threonine protein kinase
MGVHKETGQRVAIKIVPKEEPASRPADPKQPAKPKKSNRDKLEREVAIMKLIKHPNVLELYDVYETEHHLWDSELGLVFWG